MTERHAGINFPWTTPAGFKHRMNKSHITIAGAVAIFFPLVLLVDISANFYLDWYNHLWLIGYYGQYFAIHHVMPSVVNTNELLFISYPPFYGYLFHSSLGLISSLLGPMMSVRIGFFLLWTLKFWLVYQVVKLLSNDRLLSLMIACLICWEIYPLTNLFNRGDLTETFATGLITCTLCSAILTILIIETKARISYALLTGLTYALSTEHPITALYSIPFMGLMLLVVIIGWMRHQEQDKMRIIIILASLIFTFNVLVVAPWGYATISFMDRMQISDPISRNFIFFPNDLDNITTRFAPFPYDRRTLISGMATSTPFLDAQINMPLLIMLGVLGASGFIKTKQEELSHDNNLRQTGKILFLTALFLFSIATILSLSDLPYKYLPSFMSMIQFPLRMITYQNLTIFAGILALLMMFKGRFYSRDIKLIFVTLCWTLAATGVLVKISHILPIMKTSPLAQPYDLNPIDRESFLSLPSTMYGVSAFTILYPEKRPVDSPMVPVNLKVGKGNNFGDPLGFMINFSKPTWLQTNIASSPWTTILVDGVPLPIQNLSSNEEKLDIKVPAGKHVIIPQFSPDRIYVILDRMRSAVLILWVCITLGWLLFFFGGNNCHLPAKPFSKT